MQEVERAIRERRTHKAFAREPVPRETVEELLAAERIAPELVRYEPMAREMVRAMLGRERRSSNPHLRTLAGRLGLLS